MRVLLNGEPRPVEHGTTVAALLRELDVPERGVAVAIDAEVVPRSEWDARPLADGARVEVVHAVQGG